MAYPSTTIPVFVTLRECAARHVAARRLLAVLVAIVLALVGVVMASAAVGWQANTSAQVRAAELAAVNSRLEVIEARLARLEDKLDAIRRDLPRGLAGTTDNRVVLGQPSRIDGTE